MAPLAAPQALCPQHDDGPGARDLAGKFKAAYDVGVHIISGDARGEQVADLLVEDQFRRHAAVDAAHDRGNGILPFRGFARHRVQVAMLHRPGGKAGIALLQRGDDIAGVMSAWRSFVGMTQAVSAMPAPAEAGVNEAVVQRNMRRFIMG